MTDGIHQLLKMVGDVKFHEHKGVDATVAEKWKTEYKEDFLGEPTWQTAEALGVERSNLYRKLKSYGIEVERE